MNYIHLLETHPQLLAYAKELKVGPLQSFLWRNILRLYGLDYADTIEVSAYYSGPQFLVELEEVLQDVFPQVYKVTVEGMPHKVIFVCERDKADGDIIIVASWFEGEPDPAS